MVIADSIYSIRILYWLIWLLPLMVRSGTRVPLYESFYSNTIVSTKEYIRWCNPRVVWPHRMSLHLKNVFEYYGLYLWILLYENYNYRTITVNMTPVSSHTLRLLLRCTIVKFDFSSDPTLVTWNRVSVSVIRESYGWYYSFTSPHIDTSIDV